MTLLLSLVYISGFIFTMWYGAKFLPRNYVIAVIIASLISWFGVFMLWVINVDIKENNKKCEELKELLSYTKRAKCGTIVTQLPFVVEVEEGYEMTKFNPETGKLYWPSDGTYSEHSGKRKIPKQDKEQV
jgi:hypothetical protein